MKKLTVFILLITFLAFSTPSSAEMVLVYFSEAGAAKTGLTATIDIIDVADASVDVNDGALTELASGWYKHDFSGIDATKTYVWYADGSSSLCDAERYIEGVINLTTAKVNAEVVDVLKTDTITELSAGAPAKNPTLETAIMLQYMNLRNLNETTATEQRIFNDAGTEIAESDLSDAAGVTSYGELRAPN